MKKHLLFVTLGMLMSIMTFAQPLTGTKTIPGDYATIANAVAALNSQGIGSGGVTFNLNAGYTETLATPLTITATGTLANPIVFQKNGSGANPVLTAFTGIGTMDGMVVLSGSDYITFDGINLSENAANVTATTQMEWGYALLKNSITDGSQNITIKNCVISLTKTYTATKGIYSNNHTTASITQLLVSSASGANSNLKIYSNTLNNCYSGIYLSGFNNTVAPYESLFDQNNEIGKDGANIITNVAGGTSTAGYGIYTMYQNNLVVANNTITSTMAGTGIPYGIFLTTARNASYSLYGNYVSMQFTGTGTTAFYPIYSDMGTLGTNNVMNVYNNTVTGCTYPTVTNGNTYLMYLANLGVTANVYNNTITNNVIGANNVTSIGRIYYLYTNVSSTTLGPLTFHDNLVSGNSRIQSVPGGGLTHFITVAGKGGDLNMYNNLITNNIVASNGGTYLLNASLDGATMNVYDNTVNNITRAEGTVYGLYVYNITSSSGIGRFYRNKIQNIEGLTTGSLINGIYVTSYGTHYFYNNILTDFRSTTAVGANNMIGISIQSSNYKIGLYNNTVFLNNTPTSANFGSTAVYVNGAATILDFRNNIFINNSTPLGSSKTYAMRFNFTSYANYLSSSNYNNYYAGTPGPSNCIFFNGTTTYQTLSDFKTAVYPREAQSITELSPFVSITPGSANMHLQTNVPTQCETGGTIISSPISITTDFDNNPVFPNAGYPVNGSYTPGAPDLGADEFGGLSNDLTAPAIIYTPLGQTNVTTARTLTVDVTDGNGVPTSGTGLPMLYWRVNSGGYQGVQATYVSGSTYTFSFGGGVSIGDVISYYVAAQDNAAVPNVTCYPTIAAGGFTASPPACSTSPNPAFMYTVLPSISGIIHVGVGKTYATLTAAANDINVKYIAGPTTLVLDDATYAAENYPISFFPNPGSSAVNTLTIKPNTGVSPVFTTLLDGNGMIDAAGMDYLTINGSNNGTNSKNLTFENTSAFATAYVIGVKNLNADPTTNLTIKNCLIKMVPVHAAGGNMAIKFASTVGGNNNCVIDNNTINSAFTAIQLSGVSTGFTKNCQIINNIIGSPNDAEAITSRGVMLQYVDNSIISNNDIMGPAGGSLNTGQTGVYIGTGATNTKVRQNKIHDFIRTADDGWGVTGIWFSSDATTVTEISNNSIYNIHSPGINPGVGQNITYGIFVRSGGNIKILHNSISLTGAFLSTQWDASSACIGFYYQATGNNNEIRNNILRNSMTMNAGPGIYATAYGIVISTSNALFTAIDNNDYFIDGVNATVAMQWQNGFGFVAFFPTLASWQTYTGQEANSVAINPSFTSETNLLPTATALNNKGFYLTNVPKDITETMRNNPSDMGAYEFGTDPFIHTLSHNAVTYNSANVLGDANAAGTTISTYFDYGTSTSYGTSLAAIPGTVNGSTTTALHLPLTNLNFATTYHYRARSLSVGGLISYGVDSTFTTMAAPPTVITTAATSITSNSATLNGSVNANGGLTTVSFEYGLTTSYGTTAAATPGSVNGLVAINVLNAISGLTPYTTYHYRVFATNESGTIYGNDMTFTTLAVPSTVVTLEASAIIGTSATLNGTVNANYAPTNVTFEWGLTTSYGNTATASPATVTGFTTTPVNATLNGLLTATDYHFRCVGTGPGGTIYGEDRMFTSDCPTPVLPGSISGLTSVCKNTDGVVYSIVELPSATGYTWTVPTGATIVSGATTNSITVNFSVNATSGLITVAGTNACGIGLSSSLSVVLNDLPVPVISGPTSNCQDVPGNVYTTEAGMTDYVWSVTGGTITSATNTNTIVVTWTASGNQTVNVNYANSNGCEAFTPSTYAVNVLDLPVPVITGAAVACESSINVTYITQAGMSNYVWEINPNSGTIGQNGNNQITVFWTSPGDQWISVSYTNENGCETAEPTIYDVYISPLPVVDAIVGTETLCAGTSDVTYSVTADPNALNYYWTVPAGASIVSGSGTNSITVDFAANAVSGNFSVYAENNCGTSETSSMLVTVNQIPATPVITQDNYMLTSSASTGNQWYRDGLAIEGAFAQTYEAFENGIYTVIVTINGCSSDVSNNIEIVNVGMNENEAGQIINIYPNPNNGSFWLSVSSIDAKVFDMEVLNRFGAIVYQSNSLEVNGSFKQYFDLKDLSAGMYTVILKSNSQQIIRKIVINK